MKSATLTRAYRAARYPAVRKQAATCRMAPLCQWSNVELIARAKQINAESDAKAKAAVARGEYTALYLPDYTYAQGVVKVSDGTPYIGDTNIEGVYECFCADYQGRITTMNNELRRRGINDRAGCKHGNLLHEIERAAATVPLCAGMVGAAPSVVGGRAK